MFEDGEEHWREPLGTPTKEERITVTGKEQMRDRESMKIAGME
jgi:hypothetical protein